MGDVVANGIRLHYVDEGEGEETIVFSHSYLATSEHFQPQIDRLKDRYRCLAFDHRGHGRSEKPATPFGMEDIYADAVAFIEAIGCAPCHFVGLSTGGFVGLRLAIRRPELLRSLVLMDTSADAEHPKARRKYSAMLAVVRFGVHRLVAGQVPPLFFGKRFLEDPARRGELERWKEIIASNDPRSAVLFGKAIFDRASVHDQLGAIDLPTLVVVGDEDVTTPPSRARRIAEGIPGAALAEIPGAGHLCTVEEPDRVNAVLEAHLAAAP